MGKIMIFEFLEILSHPNVPRCGMSAFYESEESRLKEHLEDKHEGLYLEESAEENINKHAKKHDIESAGPFKQKQRDSIRTEKCANTKSFKCDKC